MSDNPAQPIVNTGAVRAVDTPATFKDGERVVPAWVIDLLGGPAVFARLQPLLPKVTYGAWMSRLMSQARANEVSAFMQQFVAGHLERMGRRW